jgi:hypothetical protein
LKGTGAKGGEFGFGQRLRVFILFGHGNTFVALARIMGGPGPGESRKL